MEGLESRMTTYLTRVPLDALLERDEILHKAVMSMFPTDLPGDQSRRRAESNILFMIEETTAIVSSDIMPVSSPRNVPTFSLPPRELKTGATVRFRTAVNGVRRLSAGGTSPVEDIDGWLEQKLAAALTEVSVLQHVRTVINSGRSMLQIDTIDGQAVIEDGEKLRELTRVGIGRGKSYGCGMILVAA
jgi:CRISPR system Cascade subunit CasE